MFQNQFYSEILGEALNAGARQKGYHVITSPPRMPTRSDLTLAKAAQSGRDRIVIGMYPDSFDQQMKESRIPIVSIRQLLQ